MKKNFTLCVKIFLPFFLLLIIGKANHANATARTWIGKGAGGSGTDLNTSTNWFPNGVPSSADDCTLLLTSTATLTQTTISNFRNLTVSVATAIGITATCTFTIDKGINVAGVFTCTPVAVFGSSSTTVFNLSANANFTCASVNENPAVLLGATTTTYNIASGSSFITSGNFVINDQSIIGSITNIYNSGTFTTNLTSGTTSISGFLFTAIYLKNDANATMNFNGNTTFGVSGGGAVYLQSLSSGTASNSKVYFKGNVNFEGPALTNISNNIADYIFDGSGTQTVTVNSSSVNNIRLSNVTVGSANNPTVNLAGSSNASLTSSAASANITVNGTSVLDLTTHTLNRSASGGSLNLNSTAKLRVGASTGGVSVGNSNFPSRFGAFNFSTTSTVEYYSTSAQTIYAMPTYGNLTLTNASTKTSNGIITVVNDLTNNSTSTFDVAASNYAVYVGRNWTNNGSFNAQAGTVTFNTNVNGIISGTSPTAFYKFAVDKGSSIATTLDVNGTGAISITGNNSTTTITNGLLRINSGASFTKIATLGDITINSTAGISNNGGTFAMSINGSVNNTGLFQSVSGTSTIGNTAGNSVTTSGVSTGKFDMQAGTVTIAGRLVNTAGTSSITGGTITLSAVGNTLNGTGSFDMSLSTDLTISGTPVIYFQNASTATITPYDLHILNSTGTKNIIGGTFQFGNSSTPANNIFQCYSDVPVYNMTVNNINNPNAKLLKDITVNGTLALNSSNATNGAFTINDRTLTANGIISGTGTLTGSVSSGLILGTNGNTGILYFNQTTNAATNALKIFTINSSASATLGNALNIAAGTYVSSGILKADGTLASNGNLTLKSDASGDARIDISNGLISGEVTVERYIYARRAWRLLTLPFNSSSQTIHDAWQEGYTNSSQPTTCPTSDPAPNGYGMYITYQNSNGYDWNATTNASLKAWDDVTNSYIIPASTTGTNIAAYRGYYAFVRGDRHVCIQYGSNAGANTTTLRAKGVLNQQNATSVIQSFSGAASGQWILFGNPYASPLDFTNAAYSGLNPNSFSVLDPQVGGTYGVGGYIYYSTQLPIGWSDNSGSYKLPNYNLPVVQSGQAFLAQTTAAGGSVTFHENDKVSTEFNTTGLISASPETNATRPALYAKLLLASDSLKMDDAIAVTFSSKYSAGKDEFDVPKIWNSGDNMYIATETNNFAIECRPVPTSDDTISIILKVKQQAYTLRLLTMNIRANLQGQIWLIDKYLNIQTELRLDDTTTYDFTPNTDTNSYRHRFMLVFNSKGKNIAGESQQGKNNTNAESDMKAIIFPNPASNNNIKLALHNLKKGNYTVNIYTVTGKLSLMRKINYEEGNDIYSITLPVTFTAGNYAVQIVSSEGITIKSVPLIIDKK